MMNGEKRKLDMNVWDTPGIDVNDSFHLDDFKDLDAVVLVYSIDLDSTYDAACSLFDNTKDIVPKDAIYFLAANKVDLDEKGLRQVDKSTGE